MDVTSLDFEINNNKYKLCRTYKSGNLYYHDVKNLTTGVWKNGISDNDFQEMLKKYNAKFV